MQENYFLFSCFSSFIAYIALRRKSFERKNLMKKMLYVMSAILPVVLLANLSEAQAQRKNSTDKDMKAAVEMVDKKMPKSNTG